MVEEIEKFFSLSMSNSSWKADFHGSKSDPLVLISGPASSGKTSLLFQYAINSAAAVTEKAMQSQGNSHVKAKAAAAPQVVFICRRRSLETKPPYLSQGVDPASDVFQHIQMKYVDDFEAVNRYFAAFHLHDEFPVTLIIDDFADLFDESYCKEKYDFHRGRELGIAKSLALCRDAIIHANGTGTPCKLLLSDTHPGKRGDLPRFLYIYKRWVSSIYNVKGDGCGSYILERNIYQGHANTEFQRMRTAKYSIALQYLNLEGFVEHIDH